MPRVTERTIHHSSYRIPVDSAQLFERAKKVMPGGVNTPSRSFRRVGGVPPYIKSAHGCYLVDVNARHYIDFIGSYGAMLLGHGNAKVTKAVRYALKNGTTFGTAFPEEVSLAEKVTAMMPSIDKIRLVNSGTEAVMSTLRLSRAVTNRRWVLQFRGCYHGHIDGLLSESGSGLATADPAYGADPNKIDAHWTLHATYNDILSVKACFEKFGNDIAAVIVEPVAGNMGVVPPASGFLDELQKISQNFGSLLLFDEVITGFRVSKGGAQELYGTQPDLTILGKTLGGGLPIGAYGGAAKTMDMLSPIGDVYQGGTFSGNPLTVAAAESFLGSLTDNVYKKLETLSSHLQKELSALLKRSRTHGVVQRVGSMLSLFFGIDRAQNYNDVQKANHTKYAAFFRSMLKRGVYLPPSGFESWFVSFAHSEKTIEKTLQSIKDALREIS